MNNSSKIHKIWRTQLLNLKMVIISSCCDFHVNYRVWMRMELFPEHLISPSSGIRPKSGAKENWKQNDRNNERICKVIYTGPEMTNPVPKYTKTHDAHCKTCLSPCSLPDSEGIPNSFPSARKQDKYEAGHESSSSSHVTAPRPPLRLQFVPHAAHLPWRLVMGCVIIFYAPKLAEL